MQHGKKDDVQMEISLFFPRKDVRFSVFVSPLFLLTLTPTPSYFLQAAVYQVGEVLNLPRDGVLQLAADGVQLEFTDLDAQGGCKAENPDLVWVGGTVPEERNVSICFVGGMKKM